MTTTTTETRPPAGDAARVASERTAWQYVTAMHAAAVGGPRAPLRGIVEDVEDMRVQLTRERDVARARVAELERRLAGRKTLSADDQEFIAEHVGEGLVFGKYGFADKAREQSTKAELRSLAAGAAPARAKTPAEPKALGAKALPEPAKARITLPEMLMNEGLITLDQCLEAMRYQKQNGGRFSTAFVELGFLTEKQVVAVLARVYGIPSIDLDHVQPSPALAEILPAETARKHRLLPLAATTTLTVAVADPGDFFAMDAVASLIRCSVQPVVASDAALDRAIDRCYGPARSPRKAAPSRERGLRLAWSREDGARRNAGRGPEGDRPAA